MPRPLDTTPTLYSAIAELVRETRRATIDELERELLSGRARPSVLPRRIAKLRRGGRMRRGEGDPRGGARS